MLFVMFLQQGNEPGEMVAMIEEEKVPEKKGTESKSSLLCHVKAVGKPSYIANFSGYVIASV